MELKRKAQKIGRPTYEGQQLNRSYRIMEQREKEKRDSNKSIQNIFPNLKDVNFQIEVEL